MLCDSVDLAKDGLAAGLDSQLRLRKGHESCSSISRLTRVKFICAFVLKENSSATPTYLCESRGGVWMPVYNQEAVITADN
jgi:hypothetical protein